MLILIIACLGLIGGLIWLVCNRSKIKHVTNFFRNGNVIVAGHKGHGKDLLFSMVIKEREKCGERHAANIRYTDKTIKRDIRDYCLKNTSLKNFINANFDTEQVRFTPKEDYYISEAGLTLPNWLRSDLENKKNPTHTLPITFALSRHLGEFNFHCNAQEFVRVWDKLREQADTLIYCERSKVFGRLAYQRFVVYDRLESALEHRQPIKVPRGLWGQKRKEALGHVAVYNAKYGYIQRFKLWHVLPKRPYDTRAFYKLLYKEDPPQTNKKGEKQHHRRRKNVD